MKRTNRVVVGIAGGSGSGKTTLARMLIEQCGTLKIPGQIVSLDHYYKPLDHLSFDERKQRNFDHPEALDFELAVEQVRKLKAGKPVEQPIYDYALHTRKAETTRLKPCPLLVVEGIYALRPAELLELYDFKVFVSTGLATAVLRRIERDVSERERDIEGARHQILTTVLPMYERYIKPTQRNAHFSINWEGEEIPEKATEGLVRMVRDHLR